MAGWTITDWSTNPDWADVDIVNEFITALNERVDIDSVGIDELSLFSIGDDVQGQGWIDHIQSYIEGFRSADFIISHDGGVRREPTHWDNWINGDPLNGPNDQNYSNLSDVFAATDLSNRDWRRYVDKPASEGGTVQYGKIEIGDIIGPWIFEDLMKTLNVFVWVGSVNNTWGIVSDGYNVGSGSADSDIGETWEDAKTRAEADWDSGDNIINGADAYARTTGSLSVYDIYYAQITREIGIQKFLGNYSTTLHASLAWYIYTVPWDSWNSHGNVCSQGHDLHEDKWNCWLIDGHQLASGLLESSTSMGPSVAKPNWCAEPPPSQDIGWDIGAPPVAIVMFDVASGLSQTGN